MPAIVFYIVNLPAPTDGRATRNERSSGAFGIPELRSPAAMDFHSKPSCAHRWACHQEWKKFRRIWHS